MTELPSARRRRVMTIDDDEDDNSVIGLAAMQASNAAQTTFRSGVFSFKVTVLDDSMAAPHFQFTSSLSTMRNVCKQLYTSASQPLIFKCNNSAFGHHLARLLQNAVQPSVELWSTMLQAKMLKGYANISGTYLCNLADEMEERELTGANKYEFACLVIYVVMRLSEAMELFQTSKVRVFDNLLKSRIAIDTNAPMETTDPEQNDRIAATLVVILYAMKMYGGMEDMQINTPLCVCSDTTALMKFLASTFILPSTVLPQNLLNVKTQLEASDIRQVVQEMSGKHQSMHSLIRQHFERD